MDDSDDLPEELSEFLSVAFKKPMSADRRKKLTVKYPRLAISQTKPPAIDKAILSLVQTRKHIVSHDRFLSKLQCFASDAIGPLVYLLKELQSSKGVTKEKAVQAIQAAPCFTGNTFATLSVERRRSILLQLNQQLAPMAEEEFDNNRKLFGDDFGKGAKEKANAIRSLSKSSSVFFRLGDAPHRTNTGAKGVAVKAQPIALLPTSQKDQSGARPTLNRRGQTQGSKPSLPRQKLILNRLYIDPPSLIILPPNPTTRPTTLPKLGNTRHYPSTR